MRKIVIVSLLALLCASVALAAPGKPRSDEWIEGRIRGALDFNAYFDSTDISVDVDEGVATLSGAVPSSTEKEFAERLAAHIDGVRSVKNNLTVDESLAPRSRSELAQYLSDIGTTALIKSKLAAYKLTTATDVGVTTKEGEVSLTGSVPTKEIKDRVAKIAHSTQGVVDVDNDLTIENPKNFGDRMENTTVEATKSVSDAWISTKVRLLLAFSSDLPGSKVDVTTKDGKVTLTGRARDKDQVRKIVSEVSDVVGVKGVENNLKIQEPAA